ncbi:MAG: hypothetical protein Q8P67_01060 [archaeon]|nr:hypothetical protein [archaeon]
MNALVSEAAGSRADDVERVALISTLYRLGYDGVVWNCVVSSRAAVLPPVAVPASFFMGAGAEGEGPVMTSGHSVLRLTNLRQLEHRRFQQYSRITYHNLTPGEAASFNTISNNQKFVQ